MQLCIPRVDTFYTRDYILDILYKLNWGRIIKLNESRPKNNTNYRCVMIHVDWNDNNETNDLKTILKNGGYVNIVYDINYHQFWRIMESNRHERK